jgi:hypothetical protein
MAGNYAAVGTAWKLLCEWLELDPKQGDFPRDLMVEMNLHVKETSGARQPWVWIVEKLFSEIAMNEFRLPYTWERIDDRPYLLVRTSHVMDHLSRTPALREVWNQLPIKSDRVFKRQLQQARAIMLNEDGGVRELERTLGDEPSPMASEDRRRRVAHLVALDLHRLSEFGVYAVPSGALAQSSLFPPGPSNE